MIGRRRFARLLPALLLLACCVTPAAARAGNNCAGGGRPQPDEGGIGGTGARPVAPEEDDGGVGGTGIVAHGNTGIIGTITGFASICVGELEIRYGTDSTVLVDGQPADSAQLAVGQVVEVVASGIGSEVTADQISVRHVLAGPVTRIDPERNRIEVIGQKVQLLPTGAAADLAPGAFVRISGLRRGDGVVVASLVTRAEESDLARLTGPVTRVEPGRLEVAATPIDIENGAGISIGDEVRIAGRWDGAKLVASSIEALPRIPFDGRVTRVEIEGYASPKAAGQLQVGGFLFELPPSAPGEALPQLEPDARVRIEGFVRDRRVMIERIGVSEPPSLPESRRGAPDGWKNGATGAPKDQRAIEDHREPPPRNRPDSRPPRPPGDRDYEPPPRPDRPERPAAQVPDRPERPALPDRPRLPDRPERPERPDRPEIHRRP